MENVDLNKLLEKHVPGKTLKLDESDLQHIQKEKELITVATEFLEKVRPFVETRNKLRKEQDDLVLMLGKVADKLDELIMLKNINAQQEAEVLKLIKHELLGGAP